MTRSRKVAATPVSAPADDAAVGTRDATDTDTEGVDPADEPSEPQQVTAQSVERFAALFSNLPVAVLLLGQAGEILDVNRSAQKLFQIKPRGLSEPFFHRLVSPVDYQRTVRPAFLEAQASGQSSTAAVEFMAGSGVPFRGDLQLAALPATGDEPLQFACVVVDRTAEFKQQTDITETKKAAQALRRSEAFLADTQRLAHIGGWELTVASGELRWTRETGAIHGVPEGFVPTLENTIGLYQQPSRDAFVEAVQAAIAQGESFELELDLTSVAGAALRVMVRGRPEDQDGRCVRVAGVMQDITARHEAQRRIVDLSERLGAATSAGGIGVWEWDLRSDSVYFDARTRSLLGLHGMPFGGMRDALGEALGEGAGLAELGRFDGAVKQACETGQPLNIDLDVATEPERRQVRLSGRVQRGADGEPQRLIGCAWDCTIEKLSEQMRIDRESAERAGKAKSEFLSRMSHELRTPLNAIMGFTQLMRMESEAGLPPPPSNPKRLQYIEDAAKQLLALINEVLDVSRVEAGVMEVRLDRVNLETLLAECLPLIDNQAEARGIEIVRPAPAQAVDNPHIVTADPLRLKEVLINLLSNAVKYNKPHGQIRVGIHQLGETMELSVQDTGVGMNEEQRKNLFQPFNRAGAEVTRVEGTGMGLFVSKRYAELMGGSLSVTSQAGKGSTFTVRLLAAR